MRCSDERTVPGGEHQAPVIYVGARSSGSQRERDIDQFFRGLPAGFSGIVRITA